MKEKIKLQNSYNNNNNNNIIIINDNNILSLKFSFKHRFCACHPAITDILPGTIVLNHNPQGNPSTFPASSL